MQSQPTDGSLQTPRRLPPSEQLVAVARGQVEPDLVIEGARVFCAFTREWLEGDVAISEGRIAGIGSYPGGDRIAAAGRYLVPGFIDAHVHIESSKLTPAQFAQAVVPHGTTAVVAEPHEIANVLGVEGVLWFLDACDGLPVEVFAMAPSCVPASDFESPRAPLLRHDIERMLRHPRMLGIGEMMNFPAVVAGAMSELEKLRAAGASHVDGHAPGVRGAELAAYVAAGISSDHESTTVEEALEKRRNGMWVLMREASNARNLVDLLALVREHGTDFCAFCTDDREPDFLVREGHINQMCRVAVTHGIAPEDALVLASLNPARCHSLAGHGAIAPGYHANCMLLPDLESFVPDLVLSRGRVVARDGEPVAAAPAAPMPAWVRTSVSIAPVEAASFEVAAPATQVRVIGIMEGQLLTQSLAAEPAREHDLAVADAARDLAKIAVVERHHATGRIGRGFVTGFGLQHGAFASTVAHDAHNIVTVGVCDADMALCASRLAEIGGGIVAVRDGQVLEELALPVAGLLSDQPANDVVAALDRLHAALADLGVTVEAPFMIVSFLALSVIPSLKITDHGLVDVDSFELVPLAAHSGSPA